MQDLESFEVKVREILNNCIKDVENLRHEINSEINISPQDVKERLERIRPFMELLTSKWVPEIMYALLLSGKMGFNELKNSLGISSRVLSDKLQELVREGFIQKEEIKEEKPRRVRYSLTPKGRKIVLSLAPLLFGIYLFEEVEFSE